MACRVLYIPAASVDRWHAADDPDAHAHVELVRVMVGRAEVLAPGTEQSLVEQLGKAGKVTWRQRRKRARS